MNLKVPFCLKFLATFFTAVWVLASMDKYMSLVTALACEHTVTDVTREQFSGFVVYFFVLTQCHFLFKKLDIRHIYKTSRKCVLIYEPRQANLCLRAFRHDKL